MYLDGAFSIKQEAAIDRSVAGSDRRAIRFQVLHRQALRPGCIIGGPRKGPDLRRNHITRLGTAALVSLGCAAATASAASSEGPVKGARYSGLVGPGYKMKFRVSANGQDVDGLVVSFLETCSPGAGSVAPRFHFNTLKIEHAKFSGTSTDHFGKTVSDTLKISGTFDGGKAAGKVTDKSRIKSLPNCSQTEPFTATTR